MRVLHAALMRHGGQGIARQMAAEERAAVEAGVRWRSVLFVPADSSVESGAVLKSSVEARHATLFRKEFYRWLRYESVHYDLIILRHSLADPLQILFIRSIPVPVYLMHHTFEVNELLTHMGPKSMLKAATEMLLGPLSITLSCGVVGVTPEIGMKAAKRSLFVGKRHFLLPNGIDARSILGAEDIRGEVPELVFIASQFTPWHGLDLLLDSAVRTKKSFRLHIVGKVQPEVISGVSRQEIQFHGPLAASEIRRLANRAWVGINSLGLHRNSMMQGSTLKAAEYLGAGIPVYGSHWEAVLPLDFKYYREGAPDLDSILSFAHEMRQVRRDVVRTAALLYVDKGIWVKRFISEVENGFR